jgi:hypothetical protein
MSPAEQALRADLRPLVAATCKAAGELVARLADAAAPADAARISAYLAAGAQMGVTLQFIANELPRIELLAGLVDPRDGTSEVLLRVEVPLQLGAVQ